MISDRDIYASAHAMIKRYGEAAATEAAMRADQMLADGDIDGQRIWMRIVRAIEELQKSTPGPNEQKH